MALVGRHWAGVSSSEMNRCHAIGAVTTLGCRLGLRPRPSPLLEGDCVPCPRRVPIFRSTRPRAPPICSHGAASLEQRYLWGSAVSGPGSGMEEALAEAVRQARSGWPPSGEPHLALVFVSSTYQYDYEQGGGVLGTRGAAPEEWEARPAVSITLASLPGITLRSFHVPTSGLPDADAPPQAWYDLTGVAPPEERGGHTSFVLLGDAAYSKVSDLLDGLDYAFPAARMVGGLNSSAAEGQRRALWQWSAEEDRQGSSHGLKASGCVGLALQGPLVMDTLIAQGVQSMGGAVYRVARAHRNLVLEVEPEGGGGAGMTPLALLHQALAQLGPEESDRVAGCIMVGLGADGFDPGAELGPGGFQATAVLGAHVKSGALKLACQVRAGQRLQLMVKHREAAIRQMVDSTLALKKHELDATLAGTPLPPPLGCLIFTGSGRGQGLYQEPHSDSRTLAEYVQAPSAGLFSSGEIAPAGVGTRLHGFACAAAVFRPARLLGQWQLPQQQQLEQIWWSGEQARRRLPDC